MYRESVNVRGCGDAGDGGQARLGEVQTGCLSGSVEEDQAARHKAGESKGLVRGRLAVVDHMHWWTAPNFPRPDHDVTAHLLAHARDACFASLCVAEPHEHCSAPCDSLRLWVSSWLLLGFNPPCSSSLNFSSETPRRLRWYALANQPSSGGAVEPRLLRREALRL